MLNDNLLIGSGPSTSTTANLLAIGDGTVGNKSLFWRISTGGNFPGIRYNAATSKDQLTNDGLNWADFADSSEVYLKTEMDTNYYTKAQTYSRAQVDAALAGATTGGIPSGTVLMWAGTLTNIPAGFNLCNGQNDTPDLRDKFILGAGNTYIPSNTGGNASSTTDTSPSHSHTSSNLPSSGAHSHSAATTSAGAHSHGGKVDGHALTEMQMASHTHVTGGLAVETNGIGGPADGVGYKKEFSQEAGGGVSHPDNFQNKGLWDYNFGTATSIPVPGGATHDHTISSDGAHSHIINVGVSGSHSHSISINAVSGHSHSVDLRPPYYSLAFIKKI